MRPIALLLTLTFSSLFGLDQFESSKACQKCHPVIYKEHASSMHSNASIFNDPIHKAVWDRHPLKKKKKYACAKCHTPNDKELINRLKSLQKATPQQNRAQLKEGVSCVSCHNIQSIEKHEKSNKNIITKDKKTLFSARLSEKDIEDKKFEMKQSFFGLVTKKSGSPYHHIDFTNRLYYNGGVCLGCHSHKENAQHFKVCEMDVKEDSMSNEENCISCHMPKVAGSFTTLTESKTHRYHGFTGSIHKPKMLAKYVKIDFNREKDGFTITLFNKANHALLLHPLRVGELRVVIIHNGKKVSLEPKKFMRVIGKENHPSAPWLANEVVKDTQIQAKEKRVVHYNKELQSGDRVIVTLGHYIITQEAAKKLGLEENRELTKFKVLKEESFSVK